MKLDQRIIIRAAQPGDENQLARVHIQSWQESYKGIVPQNYLEQLPSELEERIENWEKTLTSSKRWVWVAESSQGIVGFCIFGPPRDQDRDGYVELGAIYLLASEKGKGIGYSLLYAGFNKMRTLGYKKAYCWVLEKNPTIQFYKRSGATFSGHTKDDEIGGEIFTEHSYDWDSLEIGDDNWDPLSVEEVRNKFKSFKHQWWIAGGWAIDLFLGKQTRKHEDIDVLIRRDDQLELQNLFNGWDLWAADPPGTLKPWAKGEFLKKGLQDIWGRRTPKDPWQIQIMLFDTEDGDWIFKRDESIRRSLQSVTVKTSDGSPILAPEVQLLYKSKSLREKDQSDFENVLPALSLEQRDWLKDSLTRVYQGQHSWLKRL